MIRKSISIDRVIDVLNKAVKVDSEAISNLISYRFECNNELSNVKGLQVSLFIDGHASISALGLINGLFGEKDGWGPISALYSMKCKNSKDHTILECDRVGDKCSVCGSEIILGDLVKFVKSA